MALPARKDNVHPIDTAGMESLLARLIATNERLIEALGQPITVTGEPANVTVHPQVYVDAEVAAQAPPTVHVAPAQVAWPKSCTKVVHRDANGYITSITETYT